MITRRTFLRVLSSAAVGAVVAPALAPVVKALAADPIPTFSSYGGTAGALTYEMLEAAYKSCVIGERGPTLMVVSQSVARKLGLIYDAEVDL